MASTKTEEETTSAEQADSSYDFINKPYEEWTQEDYARYCLEQDWKTSPHRTVYSLHFSAVGCKQISLCHYFQYFNIITKVVL